MTISGNFSCASSALISSSGSPNVFAQPAWRRVSSQRSGEQASRMPPHSVQPGSNSPPPSFRYSSTEYIIIFVSETELRSWPTRPAEWNVEPLVSCARSSRTTSRQPSSARW